MLFLQGWIAGEPGPPGAGDRALPPASRDPPGRPGHAPPPGATCWRARSAATEAYARGRSVVGRPIPTTSSALRGRGRLAFQAKQHGGGDAGARSAAERTPATIPRRWCESRRAAGAPRPARRTPRAIADGLGGGAPGRAARRCCSRPAPARSAGTPSRRWRACAAAIEHVARLARAAAAAGAAATRTASGYAEAEAVWAEAAPASRDGPGAGASTWPLPRAARRPGRRRGGGPRRAARRARQPAGAQLPRLPAAPTTTATSTRRCDLIRRALEQDPDNGAYIDSLGWVYYRLGRLDEAREPARAGGRPDRRRPGRPRAPGRRLQGPAAQGLGPEQYRLSLAGDGANARVRAKLAGLRS